MEARIIVLWQVSFLEEHGVPSCMLDNAGWRRWGEEEKETRFLKAESFALLKFLMCMGYDFTFGALSVKEQERDEEEKMWIWTVYKRRGKSKGAGLVHSLTW